MKGADDTSTSTGADDKPTTKISDPTCFKVVKRLTKAGGIKLLLKEDQNGETVYDIAERKGASNRLLDTMQINYSWSYYFLPWRSHNTIVALVGSIPLIEISEIQTQFKQMLGYKVSDEQYVIFLRLLI